MVFDLLEIDKAVAGTLPIVALIYLIELDAQLHLHAVVELLLTLELLLRFQMLLLVPDLLPLLHCFFVVNGSKIITHILCLLGVLHSHLGLRVHVLSIYLKIIKIHFLSLPPF